MSSPDLSVNSLFNLKGKVALITGGGTGLGFMMATCYVQNGAKVYISSRKLKNLTSAADQLNAIRPNSCVTLESDVSTKAGCDSLADQIKAKEDSLDILVNNSGLSWGAPMDKTDETKGWDKVFNVNVKALFYLTVALIPLLEKGKTFTNTGSVINISSVYSYYPNATMPTAAKGTAAYSYLASKAAVNHLTRTMSNQLMPKCITVNAILPGFFPSNMTSQIGGEIDQVMANSHVSKRMGRAEDIGSIALLMATNSHLTGVLVPIDGGMSLGRIPKEVESYYKPLRDADGRAKL